MLHYRYKLSLYAHVSKISWVNPEDDTVVEGTISKPDGGDLRTFRLPVNSMSETQIVNALWDML